MAEDMSLVLVTGGSGYIATHVVKILQERGYRVRATVRSLKNEAKVKPLRDLCPDAKHPLELVEADLMNDESWVEAVKGCTYVQHIASPLPVSNPADENDVIAPAVNGTLAVLKACGEDVKRVILTSSIAAINAAYDTKEAPWNESDWTDPEKVVSGAYVKSKTLAEKVAWDFIQSLPEERRFELAVINPGFVMGPILCGSLTASMELPKRLMQREMPTIAKLGLPMVDVRDVAAAHVKAMILPEAAGHRHIIVNESHTIRDIALILDEEFRPQGYSIPTYEAPSFLVKFASLFDRNLRMVTPGLGKMSYFDNTRMKTVLGITPHTIKDMICDMVYTMIEAGFIKKTSKYTGPRSSE